MRATLLRILLLCLLLPLAVGAPVWAQLATETWTNFVLGSPQGAPTNSDVIACIESNGISNVTRRCTLTAILALAPNNGNIGGGSVLANITGDCVGTVANSTMVLSCPTLMHLNTTTDQVLVGPATYNGSAQVGAKIVSGSYSWTVLDPQIYDVDVSGGFATLTFGSSAAIGTDGAA